MGRILLNLALIVTLLISTGHAFGAPPAWFSNDLQAELPLFEPDSNSNPTTANLASEDPRDELAPGEDPGPTDDDPYKNPVPSEELLHEEDVPAGPHDNEDGYDEALPSDTQLYDENGAPYEEGAPSDELYDEDGIAYEDLDAPTPRLGIQGPRPPIAEIDPPDWLVAFEDWLKSLDSPDIDVMPVLKTLGIGFLVLLALLAIATIFRRLRKFQMPIAPARPPSALENLRQMTASVPHHVLATDLRWEIAIHALLLDALTDLAPRFAFVESPDATCREIAALIETQPGPLTELVGLSEACIFALLVATEDQYRRAEILHAQITRSAR